MMLEQHLVEARFHWARRRLTRMPSPRQVRRTAARAARADRLRRQAVAASARHLQRFERSIHSQNGEDGIIAEIFRRIGVTERSFVELGSADGSENCTRALIAQGWTGVWVEGDLDAAASARDLVDGHPVRVLDAFVDRDNVVALLREARAEEAMDLLVIDLDGNDWWIWRAVAPAFRPRVVVVEYNAAIGPGWSWRMPYDATHRWDGSARFGASLAAWARLGDDLDYKLVGCDSAGVNAFFVRRDLAEPFDRVRVRRAYAPARYALGGHPWAPPVPVDADAVPPEDELVLELDRIHTADPAAGQPLHVTAWLHNRSRVAIGAPATRPVHLAWRWRGDAGEPVRALGQVWQARPGERVLLGCQAVAPAEPSDPHLELELVQEGLRWFPAGRLSLPITLAPDAPLASLEARSAA